MLHVITDSLARSHPDVVQRRARLKHSNQKISVPLPQWMPQALSQREKSVALLHHLHVAQEANCTPAMPQLISQGDLWEKTFSHFEHMLGFLESK